MMKPKGYKERKRVLFEKIETGQDIKYKIGVSVTDIGTQITLNGVSYSD